MLDDRRILQRSSIEKTAKMTQSLAWSLLATVKTQAVNCHHPSNAVAQGTPKPSEEARSLAIAESKGSADARAAAESAQRRIDIAVEATKRLAEVCAIKLPEQTSACAVTSAGLSVALPQPLVWTLLMWSHQDKRGHE